MTRNGNLLPLCFHCYRNVSKVAINDALNVSQATAKTPPQSIPLILYQSTGDSNNRPMTLIHWPSLYFPVSSYSVCLFVCLLVSLITCLLIFLKSFFVVCLSVCCLCCWKEAYRYVRVGWERWKWGQFPAATPGNLCVTWRLGQSWGS